MCGIVALHGRQDETWIGAMNARLRHRGPDDEGIFRDREADLTLAMRRLAILDIAGGAQPMTSPDGRYTIVYNGEIFNAPDLRRELEAEGERFVTDHSDTEVLLRLLVRYKADALPRLNGMFAFVFYDRDAGTLLCARDRFGIKPLYYTTLQGRLAVASEIKSFCALPGFTPVLDRQSFYHYVTLMYVPGEASILEGVQRVPPGGLLRYELRTQTHSVTRWWKPSFGAASKVPAAEWPGLLLTEFRSAVRRWTLSDVPVACSLSGGLDSSAIVGALAESGVPVSTFALGFTGDDEADWNELPRARMVARHWGTRHHELVLDPERLLDDLVSMVWHLDEPYGGGLPSWSVFRFMAEDVKVGLTGTGGDELFGNYGKWRPLEGGLLRRLLLPQDTGAAAFARHFSDRFYYATDDEKRSRMLATRDGFQSTSEHLYGIFSDASSVHTRDRVAATDIGTQLSEEFLLMTDRFSMAHSLEARTPFLDSRFADLALSVPAALRTSAGDLKGLLRRTVAPLLPPENRNLPKRGFVIPLKLWLRGRLRGLTERLLAPERLAAQGLFRPEFYSGYVRPHLEGRADHTNKVWAAVMFQLWHMLFIERGGTPDFTLADIAS